MMQQVAVVRSSISVVAKTRSLTGSTSQVSKRSFSIASRSSIKQRVSVVRPSLFVQVGATSSQDLISAASKLVIRRSFASLPSHTKLGLPALSPSMEKGNLVKWRKKEGDKLAPGDIIAEIETDKATVEFENTETGFLAKILVPAGTKDIVVGDTIGIMVEDAKDVAAFKDYQAGGAAPAQAPKQAEQAKPAEQPKPAEAQQTQQKPQQQQPQQQQPQQQRSAPQSDANVVPGAPPAATGFVPKSGLFASPLAKNLASHSGVDLKGVQGTGPNSRIIAADVSEAQQAAPARQQQAAPVSAPGAAYTDIPNSQIRKVTAQRLTMSKQTIPHYYLSVECKVDQLLKLRQALNDGSKGSFKLSVNDFVVKAAALALRKVPAVNSSWTDEAIRRYNSVDINVAVNTEKGLFTPLIKDADKIGLAAINNQVKELAEKAKANKIGLNEIAPGTFTISNLGMFGISHFSAVINPPQACILAVGGTEQKVVVDEKAVGGQNQFKVSNVMSVTLSCDHRVVDGAIGAEWLKSFREYLEEPTKMLL